jgi:hypothetical protein
MLIDRVIEEAVDELTGRSKSKWALMVVMFVLGAATIVVLALKANPRPSSAGSQQATDQAGDSQRPVASPSAWAMKRAKVARTEAEMRARVATAASRLNPRRHPEAAEPPV